MSSFFTKQRGQGYMPLSRILHSSTLEIGEAIVQNKEQYLLFRIIRRIDENTRIKSPLDAICAENKNTMLINIAELFIAEQTQDAMEKLTATMGKQGFAYRLTGAQVSDEVANLIGKLQ